MKSTKKLGRSPSHRSALIASLVCNFIEERRITTTLAKAKMARSVAEKMVTLGKNGTLSARRQAIAVLRQKERVSTLFAEIVPQFSERTSGYTRIVKKGRRKSDGSEMAILEWVGVMALNKKKKSEAPAASEPKTETDAETKEEKK